MAVAPPATGDETYEPQPPAPHRSIEEELGLGAAGGEPGIGEPVPERGAGPAATIEGWIQRSIDDSRAGFEETIQRELGQRSDPFRAFLLGVAVGALGIVIALILLVVIAFLI